MLEFPDKCRNVLVIFKLSYTCAKLGGGDILRLEIFMSLKVCYPEKWPSSLSGSNLHLVTEESKLLRKNTYKFFFLLF